MCEYSVSTCTPPHFTVTVEKKVLQTVYFKWHRNLILGIAASALHLALCPWGGGGVQERGPRGGGGWVLTSVATLSKK